MEKLGMAVGYPVIMGLILSLGALIPLAQAGAAQLATKPGMLLIAGTLVVLFGIVLCSQAAAAKTANGIRGGATGAGLAIAVFAGIFSCLPNVGLNNAAALTASASQLGATPQMAGNAAWVVQFTAGFAVNFAYCLFLIARRRNPETFGRELPRNIGLVAAMASMWIGSFYLYGMGAAHMGRWGAIVGWPLFLSLAILVGNVWGLWRGEWAAARPVARARLNHGLMVVLLAVVLFGAGSASH
jgi:L-rhamnose-H+ transport protein